MPNYSQNETVTISLERYEELKQQLNDTLFRCKALEECFDVFPSDKNPLNIKRIWHIRTDTAKEQIEKVAKCLGYKCAETKIETK